MARIFVAIFSLLVCFSSLHAKPNDYKLMLKYLKKHLSAKEYVSSTDVAEYHDENGQFELRATDTFNVIRYSDPQNDIDIFALRRDMPAWINTDSITDKFFSLKPMKMPVKQMKHLWTGPNIRVIDSVDGKTGHNIYVKFVGVVEHSSKERYGVLKVYKLYEGWTLQFVINGKHIEKVAVIEWAD